MKTCAACKREKPLDDFAKRSSVRDGRQSYCRVCSTAARAERIRTVPKALAVKRAYKQRYQREHPERNAATKKLHRALKSGCIKRGTECEKCSSTDYIHGHHDDYSRPLDVRWLCAKCHHRWHARERNAPEA